MVFLVPLTLFEALIFTHFVVDWIFQWREALYKTKKFLSLLFHSVIYTLGFIPVFLIYHLNFIWLLLLFISHMTIDQGKIRLWILEKFKRVKSEEIERPLWWILIIGIDQTLHIIILAIIAIVRI